LMSAAIRSRSASRSRPTVTWWPSGRRLAAHEPERAATARPRARRTSPWCSG
jgi:hypothetical protein